MKIDWSKTARSDLQRIQAYYVRRNPQAARKLAARIREVAKLLQEFPFAAKPNRNRNCRLMQVSRTAYVLPYIVHEESIEILAVFDQRQERPDYLQ